MTKEEFINALDFEVTKEQIEKLEIYIKFLQEYNKHTNLTRIIEEKDIYLKHFYDSLMITKEVDLNKINSLLDIGSGAGFPGMVLKIFYPNLNVTLIDSNNKKTKFLECLSKELNLQVEIINDRVENYAKNNLNSFDVVTSRAVANLRVLSEISLPLVSIDGLFIPLKGNVDEELQESLDTIEIMNGKLIKQNTFYLYKNDLLRNIIVIQKQAKTKVSQLRSYDKIIKKPLKKIIK